MRSGKHAIVIFDSRFGNTEKIAKALERGLTHGGIETKCVNAKELLNMHSLKEYDLVAVGAPTEWLTASKLMKEFLENFKKLDLRGKWGFAFDTKLGRRFSGSAAGRIEKYLKKSGISLVAPHESAIVYGTDNSMASMRLKDGEEERFQEIGAKLGAAVRTVITV